MVQIYEKIDAIFLDRDDVINITMVRTIDKFVFCNGVISSLKNLLKRL